MAKALHGHLVGPDPRAALEINALRRRIAELQDQVERLSTELAAAQHAAPLAVDLDDELRALGGAHAASPA